MDYRLTDEDKERIKLLSEISKNKFKNLSLEQLKRLQKLVEKKDYTNQKKANKSKKKLLSQINVEIYKRIDGDIWKLSNYIQLTYCLYQLEGVLMDKTNPIRIDRLLFLQIKQVIFEVPNRTRLGLQP